MSAPNAAPGVTGIAHNFITHLRLHFQLLLAPIFLWGFLLAGGDAYTRDFLAAFIAFHHCLYGGTTAFNSYYDRDEGPVGGLKKPPPVTRALLPLSLLLQAAGALLAATVNLLFLLIYLTIFVMATAYSHPRLRWKARPFLGLSVVALGQGTLAALGGWAAAKGTLGGLGWVEWLGVLAVTLITAGFYPLTQIYQIDEDQARGDRTFAATVGPRGTFRFALAVLTPAAVLLVIVLALVVGWLWALMVGLFYATLLLAIAQWARTYDPAAVLPNFRRIMRIYTVTSGGFLLFLVSQLFLG